MKKMFVSDNPLFDKKITKLSSQYYYIQVFRVDFK